MQYFLIGRFNSFQLKNSRKYLHLPPHWSFNALCAFLRCTDWNRIAETTINSPLFLIMPQQRFTFGIFKYPHHVFWLSFNFYCTVSEMHTSYTYRLLSSRRSSQLNSFRVYSVFPPDIIVECGVPFFWVFWCGWSSRFEKQKWIWIDHSFYYKTKKILSQKKVEYSWKSYWYINTSFGRLSQKYMNRYKLCLSNNRESIQLANTNQNSIEIQL